MTENMEWDREFAARKEQVKQQLIKDGKVDWEYLEQLSGKRIRKEFSAALGVLLDMNILTMNRKGFFAMASGIFCNPRAPVLWGMELYFIRREDCKAYVETQFRHAQYHVDIAEMT